MNMDTRQSYRIDNPVRALPGCAPRVLIAPVSAFTDANGVWRPGIMHDRMAWSDLSVATGGVWDRLVLFSEETYSDVLIASDYCYGTAWQEWANHVPGRGRIMWVMNHSGSSVQTIIFNHDVHHFMGSAKLFDMGHFETADSDDRHPAPAPANHIQICADGGEFEESEEDHPDDDYPWLSLVLRALPGVNTSRWFPGGALSDKTLSQRFDDGDTRYPQGTDTSDGRVTEVYLMDAQGDVEGFVIPVG